MYGGYGGFIALFVAIAGIVFYFVAVIAFAILRIVGYLLLGLLGVIWMYLWEKEVPQNIWNFYCSHYVSFVIGAAISITAVILMNGLADHQAGVLLILVCVVMVLLAIATSLFEYRTIKL